MDNSNFIFLCYDYFEVGWKMWMCSECWSLFFFGSHMTKTAGSIIANTDNFFCYIYVYALYESLVIIRLIAYFRITTRIMYRRNFFAAVVLYFLYDKRFLLLMFTYERSSPSLLLFMLEPKESKMMKKSLSNYFIFIIFCFCFLCLDSWNIVLTFMKWIKWRLTRSDDDFNNSIPFMPNFGCRGRNWLKDICSFSLWNSSVVRLLKHMLPHLLHLKCDFALILLIYPGVWKMCSLL